MVGGSERTESPLLVREAIPLLLLGAFGFLLALPASQGPILGVATLAASLAAIVALRIFLGTTGKTLALVPVLVGFGTLAAWAPLGPLEELLAGGAGLSILLYLGTGAGASGSLGNVSGPLLLPSLGVVLGVVAGMALPGLSGKYGIGAALLVGVLLLAAWLYSRPRGLAGGEPGPDPVPS
jgi:hypothetical protein